MEKEVDVLICQKNNRNIIDRCIKSVLSQTYKHINVFLLDNFSTDGSFEHVKKSYPTTKCIKVNGRGVSYNRNIGIKKGSGDYIVTMDSDAYLTKTWIEKMVNLMEKNKNIGIASGKILYDNPKNLINVAGGHMNPIGIVKHFGSREYKNSNNEARLVFYLCSASMIIRRSILNQIGLFDGDYFYGYEDLDLCWRANLAGFDVYYYPEAKSFHEENTTIKKMKSTKATFLSSRNRMLTLFKNSEIKTLIKYFPLMLLHLFFLLSFRSNPWYTIKGYVWNIRNLDKIKRERKRINSFRKLSDIELRQKVLNKEGKGGE